MKSVILIEKPNKCMDCKLCVDNTCIALEKDVYWDDIDNKCPLIDLPEKQVCNERDFEHYVNGYGKGWNDFRGHLTGEYNNYEPEPYKE